MNVFDASALLAFLQGEEGSELVESGLTTESVCGAANWSEVAQKVASREKDWGLVKALLLSYGLEVEPVLTVDAESAAMSWRPGTGWSLADRLCMALGRRLDADVWTADRHWGSQPKIRQIR